MKRHVYIFRGAPASGKGTIVPEFAKLLPKPVALIEQDKLRWGFHLVGRSVEEIAPEEHRMAHENTLFLFERYLLSHKYTVVIEGLFSWDDNDSNEGSVKDLIDLALKHGFSTTSIVLKADKETLWERNKQRRSYTTPRGEFDTLYNSVYGKVDDSEIIIDSTDKSSEEVLSDLHNLIEL